MPRAVVCAGNGPYAEVLQLRDVPALEVPARCLKVRVECAGLAFPDLLQVEGKYQSPLRPPYVPVMEVAGRIVAVGADVPASLGWRLGDRVVGFARPGSDGHLRGGLGEEALLGCSGPLRVPPGVGSGAAVAMLRNYKVTHHALVNVGKVRAGETLLVLGAAGACGLCAIDLGRALGARVVACASSAAKLEACRAAGADVVIDYEEGGPDAFLSQLRGAQLYRKIDVIFDPVGGRYAEAAFRALATLGRFVVFGFASGGTEPRSAFPNIPANLLLMRAQQLLGSITYGELVERGEVPRESLTDDQLQDPTPGLLAMVQEGRLRPFVNRVYALEDFMEAFDDLAQRRAIGKVLVSADPAAVSAPQARL